LNMYSVLVATAGAMLILVVYHSIRRLTILRKKGRIASRVP